MLPNTNPLFKPQSFHINRKMILLVSLAIVILILLLLNLFFSSSRRIPANIKPTPIPISSTPTPAVLPINIPTQFQDLFNQIEKLLQPEPDFLPPALDPQISP